MIGTRGVPAAYGGFETAVEEVGRRLVERGHRVTVYCRNADTSIKTHLGMELVHLPAVKKRSLETLSHTGLSVLHAMKERPDAAILFNAGNAPFIGWLKAAGIPSAVHMDGLGVEASEVGRPGRQVLQAGRAGGRAIGSRAHR